MRLKNSSQNGQILTSSILWALIGSTSALMIAPASANDVDDVIEQTDELHANGRFEEAIIALQPFATLDDARIEFQLALSYMNAAMTGATAETVGDIDIAPALYWAERAVEHGSGGALNALYLIYGNGLGVPQDLERAIEYLRRGAERGDHGAMLNLAIMLYEGGGLPQDVDQACGYFAPLLETNAAAIAAYYLGIVTLRGQCGRPENPAVAMEFIRTAAEHEYPRAQRDMGRFYEFGISVEPDIEAALAWYERAARNEDPDSLWRMGMAYVNGRDRARDSRLAVRYFRAAADFGSVDGLVSLAVMYATGDGVEQDLSEAHLLYEEAAALGSAQAMKNLGGMYFFGEGVAQDRVRGMLLLEESAALGNKDAIALRDELRPKLSADELGKVDRQKQQWGEGNAAE